MQLSIEACHAGRLSFVTSVISELFTKFWGAHHAYDNPGMANITQTGASS